MELFNFNHVYINENELYISKNNILLVECKKLRINSF